MGIGDGMWETLRSRHEERVGEIFCNYITRGQVIWFV